MGRMAITVHDFDWPDRLVIGTIGRPGARTFYLQVRQGDRLMTIGLEKPQAEALAERVDEVLDELMQIDGNPSSVPAMTPEGLVDNDPLEEPIQEMYRTGLLGVGWEPATAQIVIEAYSLVVVDEEDVFDETEIEVEPDEVMSIRLPVGSSRAFAKRTREIVGAGRPLCELCRMPIDDEDHVCTLPDGFR